MFYYDDTIFGSGEDGFAITDRFIYSNKFSCKAMKNSSFIDEPSHVKLTDITDSHIETPSALILETKELIFKTSSVKVKRVVKTDITFMGDRRGKYFLKFFQKLLSSI